MIKVTVNRSQMAELKALLEDFPKEIPNVLRRAINKTAVTARKKVLDAVARRIAVKKSDLRRRNVTLTRASFRRLAAIIAITGRRIPLLKFGARQIKKGVSYRIIRQGGRKKILSAFMEGRGGQAIRMPRKSGGTRRGVFARKGTERIPTVELMGPSVPAAAEDITALQEAALDYDIGGQLEREISSQVQWVLAKRRGVA